MAAGCISCQSQNVKDALDKEIASRGWQRKCQSKGVGCMGLCAEGPLVSTSGKEYFIQAGDAADVRRNPGRSWERTRESGLVCRTDVPFFQRQKKIVLENSGLVDPERIEDYIGCAGYGALMHVLTEMTPREVVRGGGQERSARAWRRGLSHGLEVEHGRQSCRTRRSTSICNADEGDPGAFMDRSVLESDPHRVLEGMLIAAYAVGAIRRLHLRARRVSAGHQASADRHSPGGTPRLARDQHLRNAASASTSTCVSAPAPSSAARRRR